MSVNVYITLVYIHCHALMFPVGSDSAKQNFVCLLELYERVTLEENHVHGRDIRFKLPLRVPLSTSLSPPISLSFFHLFILFCSSSSRFASISPNYPRF
jgi:hypothetical protein